MFDPEEHLVDELREKLPGTGKKADYGNSRNSAIKLFCLECQGGDRIGVEECTVYRCSLWLYRPYGSRERPGGHVPTESQYEDCLVKKFRAGTRQDELFGGENAPKVRSTTPSTP